MSKKRDSVFSDVFSLAQNKYQPKPVKEKRSIFNVYDDDVWGTHWGHDREAARDQLLAREAQEAKKAQEYKDSVQAHSAEKQARIAANPDGPFQWARVNPTGTRYHINPDGKANRCTAEVRACPYDASDHFALPFEVPLDAQQIAGWILERREGTTATKAEISVDAVAAENPRLMAWKARATAKAQGKRANIIEVEATIELAHTQQPVKISRKIGNTIDNRWADHAYWVLDDGHHTPRVTDSLSTSELDDFITEYLYSEAQQESDDVRQEIADELRSQISHIMLTAEGEAAKAEPNSVHYSTAQLSFDDEFEFEGNAVKASINFATSGFEPSHLDAFGAVAPKRIHNVEIAEGFEVYDTDAGDGMASWKMVKGDQGWDLSIQGTRGDIALFQVADPQDAAAKFGAVFKSRVRAQDPRKARYFGEPSVDNELDPDLRLDQRRDFITELIEEDHERNGHRPSFQPNLFG